MVNSYRRSDGPEGAHTCQKIFCHHLFIFFYSGVDVFSGLFWHTQDDEMMSLFLTSGVNKSA